MKCLYSQDSFCKTWITRDRVSDQCCCLGYTEFTINIQDTVIFYVSELMMVDIVTPLQCCGFSFTLFQMILQLFVAGSLILLMILHFYPVLFIVQSSVFAVCTYCCSSTLFLPISRAGTILPFDILFLTAEA